VSLARESTAATQLRTCVGGRSTFRADRIRSAIGVDGYARNRMVRIGGRVGGAMVQNLTVLLDTDLRFGGLRKK
jgi:hypothetical protein